MNSLYNLLVEGCYHEAPSLLQMAGLEERVPSDATCLTINSPRDSWHLYGTTHDFRGFSPYSGSKTKIHRLDSSIKWIFEGIRSFLSTDGRLFVDPIYIEKPHWEWYLATGLSDLINNAREIFNEGVTVEEINNRRVRLF
jgi:hypothetical protein